jgi:hypothetical protein
MSALPVRAPIDEGPDMPHPIAALLLAASSLGLAHSALAQDKPAETPAPAEDFWRVIASPYTVHFHSPNEDEHESVYMLGIERQFKSGWLVGGTYFSNSFGQPSGYFYAGEKITNFSRFDKLFAYWTAGIIYGYKDPYEDKVPLNYKGFSPGIVLALGWQFTREFSMQANLLGTAGLMVQFSYDLR